MRQRRPSEERRVRIEEERKAQREKAALDRRVASKEPTVNLSLFGPPIKIDEKVRKKLRDYAFAEQVRCEEKRTITIQQYRERKEVEFIILVPDKQPPSKDDSRYLASDNFTEYEIYQCIAAAIKTLPRHIAAAFTIEEYLSTNPITISEVKQWKYGIIGFEPRIPPPARLWPSFKLVNNFKSPPPASENQHRYWKKHWKKLERIILHRFRIHIRSMLRLILIELAKLKERNKKSK